MLCKCKDCKGIIIKFGKVPKSLSKRRKKTCMDSEAKTNNMSILIYDQLNETDITAYNPCMAINNLSQPKI